MFCDAGCKRKAQRQRDKEHPTPKQAPPCSVDGCVSSAFAKGICAKHYTRLRTKGTLDGARKNAKGTCSHEECNREHLARGLCELHYRYELRGERKQRLALELADRRCLHCDEPMPPTRNAAAIFCSQECKRKERVASGRASESSKRHYFGKQYGLTVEQVREMAEAGCGICGTREWQGRHGRPHVDHDHATGAVRGILCSECNIGLGKFRDDPATLERAIVYLLKAGEAQSSQTVLA
jgi:hypothetical protein